MAKTNAETRAHAQRVLDYLAKHPHNQSNFFKVSAHEYDEDAWKKVVIDDKKNVCNTTLCVAGASQWLHAGKKGLSIFASDEDEGTRRAGTRLGLDEGEYEYLFYDTDESDAVDILYSIASGDVADLPSR